MELLAKSAYLLDEIANKWECSINDLLQYWLDDKLRIAIFLPEVACEYIFICENDNRKVDISSENGLHYLSPGDTYLLTNVVSSLYRNDYFVLDFNYQLFPCEDIDGKENDIFENWDTCKKGLIYLDVQEMDNEDGGLELRIRDLRITAAECKRFEANLTNRSEKNNRVELYGPFLERIDHWLSLDTWSISEATFLIAGILPEPYDFYDETTYFMSDGGFTSALDQNERDELFEKISDIERLWKSNPTYTDRATVSEWLGWADSKNIKPDWLDKPPTSHTLDREKGIKLEDAVSSVLTQRAKNAARKRHESTYKLKDYAISLFMQNNFKSTRNAAQQIFPLVQKYADQEGVPKLSDTNGCNTIYNWLLSYSKPK